jgi:hypothetical protein
MYGIIKGVVLSGPDYPELERILFLRTTIPQSQFEQSVRLHDYLDWKDQQTVFEEMAAWYGTSVNLSGADLRAETFRGVRLTASTFSLLREQALVGRVFTEAEDLVEDQDIVILGCHVWVNRFDRDPDIIGKTIRANARTTTVVGVMPEGFRFPELHDMWLPLGTDPGQLERREGPGLQVIGRLAPGRGQDEALSQLRAIGTRLEEQFPEANRDIAPLAEPLIDAVFVDEEPKGLLYTMFAAVIGVLLIACANVANLLFAITIARGKGFVLSKFSLDLFTRVVTPLGVPPWMVFELSGGVILFVIGITFAAALVSGFLPALQATRGDVHALLQDQARGSSSRAVGRWSTALVVIEVALSCALLVGAGLMVRSTLQVQQADHGIDRFGVLTARLGLPEVTYPDSTARREVADRLMTELSALPGVNEVSLSSSLPVLGTSLRFYGVGDRDYVDDSEYPFSGYTRVSPGFFDLLDAPIGDGPRVQHGRRRFGSTRGDRRRALRRAHLARRRPDRQAGTDGPVRLGEPVDDRRGRRPDHRDAAAAELRGESAGGPIRAHRSGSDGWTGRGPEDRR